jgi:serine-type D-Ala-D-Ala carboxypeptidase (penicillin-binding protein 5/6)
LQAFESSVRYYIFGRCAVLRLKILNAARFFATAGIAVCLLISSSPPLRAKAVSAKSYALIDQSCGRVISSSNENARLPMASTTKIMTALIAVESGKLDETFTVPPEALRVEGSSMGLAADEKITLRELVYGLMLESGNDAANAIAILLAGSISDFVVMMNTRAGKLGLANTHFCNPSGLYNVNHYTSALDLARLAAAAMKNADFAEIAGTRKICVSYNGIKNGRSLCNHNRLLGSYGGALGVKTGFTKKSGRCLVSCAKRNGVELIAVTLNDPDDWKDHAELLDSGFKALKSTRLLNTAPQITANVVGGAANTVGVSYDKDAAASLKAGEIDRVKLSVELDRFYYAPIKKGETLGRMVYTVDGVTVASSEIKASRDVAAQKQPEKPLGFFKRLWFGITHFFQINFIK